MGATPLVLPDNFYDYTLHPSYIVSNPLADDIAGHEVWRIGTNTRDLQSWAPSLTNTTHHLVVDTQAPNAANIVILDRGHNLGGSRIQVEGSVDGFVSSDVLVGGPWTIPTSPGGLPTSPNGCLTPEGVFWAEFNPQSFRYWLIRIPAMGIGLAPIVTNLFLGSLYRFPQYVTGPSADSFRTSTRYRANKISRRGLRVKTRPMPYSIFSLNHYQINAPNYAAFDNAIRPLINFNHPWWICRDDTDPTACSLMKPYQLPGDFEYVPSQNPVHREVDLTLEEVYPRTFV